MVRRFLNVDTVNEYVGIGTATPGSPLSIYATSTNTVSDSQAAYTNLDYVPASAAGSVLVNGVTGYARTQATTANLGTAVVQGGRFVGEYYGTSVAPEIRGVDGVATNSSTGTITDAFGGVFGVVNGNASGTIDTAAGIFVNSGNNSGTINNGYGIYVRDQNDATANYGIAIEGASTQALWIGSAADNTDAANGIAFGQSLDTNIYRSAANTLRTDDTLSVGGDIGIGLGSPDAPLQVISAANDVDSASIIHVNGNLAPTNATYSQSGARIAPIIAPTVASSGTFNGISVVPTTTSSNLASSTVNGIDSFPYFGGTGNLTQLTGIGTGRENASSGTVTLSYGVFVGDATNSGGGSISGNYGLRVSDQTSGDSDYGIAIDGADTQALWVSSAANTTDAANGIGFGLSRDTNLYRSAADTLRTDDDFIIQGGQLSIYDGVANTFTIQAEGAIGGNYTVSIPTEISGPDFICLENAGNCSGGSTTLQDAYDNDGDGASADIILTAADGHILIRDAASTVGDLFVIESDGSSTQYLTVNSTTGVTADADVTIAAGNSLILPGSGTLPGSPVDGQIYYDSTNDQIVIYDADGTGQWEQLNGSNSATYVVAASNSARPELADYRGDGVNDENAINSAISAAASAGGGTVYLMEGTFNIRATVNLSSDVSLVGAGQEATVLYIPNGTNSAFNMIVASNDSDIRVSHLTIDGNNAGQTTNNTAGIVISGAAATNAVVDSVTSRNMVLTEYPFLARRRQ